VTANSVHHFRLLSVTSPTRDPPLSTTSAPSLRPAPPYVYRGATLSRASSFARTWRSRSGCSESSR